MRGVGELVLDQSVLSTSRYEHEVGEGLELVSGERVACVVAARQ